MSRYQLIAELEWVNSELANAMLDPQQHQRVQVLMAKKQQLEQALKQMERKVRATSETN